MTPDTFVLPYDYNALGRLDTQTDRNADGETLASYDYTVRADGKRTDLDETLWFDADADGMVDAGEQKSTAYDWAYDPVGRLTDEVISHFDITKSQTDHFTYDLTGNRTSFNRDKANNSSIDEMTSYNFDVNDRMITELYNDLTVANADTVTSYGYDHTQQTSKLVTSGSVTLSKQLFAYNLFGSMSSVINEGYTGVMLSSVERTRYEYDSKSYRVNSLTETDVVTSGVAQNTWTVTSKVSFLADHHNHTGYAQTIRETKVENGNTLIQDYTFGNDEILQRIHAVQADGTAVDKTLIFGHDGHGSVRIVYNPTGKIEQTYTFTAYGNRISVHDYQGNPLALDAALTQLGYSGEYHDQKSSMQYLRARWMRDGFFITRDPFAGNMQDPQSLHKYAYVHGDPIQGSDPSGETTLVGMISSIANMTMQVARTARTVYRVYQFIDKVQTFIEVAEFARTLPIAIPNLQGEIRRFIQGMAGAPNLSAIPADQLLNTFDEVVKEFLNNPIMGLFGTTANLHTTRIGEALSSLKFGRPQSLVIYIPSVHSQTFVRDTQLRPVPGFKIYGMQVELSFGGAGGRLWGIGFAKHKKDRTYNESSYQLFRVDYHGVNIRDHLHREPYAKFFRMNEDARNHEFHWQIPTSPKDARGNRDRE
jgi:RHS repeat-associated protein